MSTTDSTFFLWSSLSRIPAHSFPVFSPSKEIDDNGGDTEAQRTSSSSVESTARSSGTRIEASRHADNICWPRVSLTVKSAVWGGKALSHFASRGVSMAASGFFPDVLEP